MAAVSIGISENFAFYLLSIANACSAVGRVLGGLLSDRTGKLHDGSLLRVAELFRTGPLNIMAPATLIAGIMTFIWPFANSIGGNIAVAVIYGYVPELSGAAAVLTQVKLQRILGSLRLHAVGTHCSDGSDRGCRGAHRHVLHPDGIQRRSWPSHLRRHQRRNRWIQVYGYLCRYASQTPCRVPQGSNLLTNHTGATIVASVVFLMLTRISVLGGLWGKC